MVSKAIIGRELMTNARKLVLLGHSLEAYNNLKQVVRDVDALKILQGHYRLAGNSFLGFRVEEDPTEEYFNQLVNSYVGKYCKGSQYYEPYALTVEITEEDVPEWILMRAGGKQKKQLLQSYVAGIWGEDPTSDIAIHLGEREYAEAGGDGPGGWALFRKTTPDPFWVKKTLNPLAAVTEWVDAFGCLPLTDGSADFTVPQNVAPLQTKETKPYTPYTPKPYTPYVYTPKKEYTQEELDALRDKVLEASKAFIDLEVDGVAYRIPQEPFEQWVLKARPEMATPWEPISPKGILYYNDCPFRTDWMLGAGIPLNSFYNSTSPVMKAVDALSKSIKADKLEFPAQVFSASTYGYSSKVFYPETMGKYEYGVAVVEEASSDYFLLAMKCSAIIAERPGDLLHIARLKDHGFTIVILPNARKILAEGTYVKIEAKKQTVELAEAPYYTSYSSTSYKSTW